MNQSDHPGWTVAAVQSTPTGVARSALLDREVDRPGGTNVHLYPSPITNETRIGKICSSLENLGLFDEILTVGVWQEGLPETQLVSSKQTIWRVRRFAEGRSGLIGKSVKTLAWTLGVLWRLRKKQITCVNCHSLPVLPVSVMLKLLHRSKLVYDTHELETETTVSRGVRRPLLRLLERALLPFVDEVCVVSDSIAQWYRSSYRLPRVHVVRNVPHRSGLRPGTVQPLKQRFHLPAESLLFLYHGVLNRGRRIEQFLRIFSRLKPDRHLLIMGYGELESLVRTAARDRTNIHFLPAVRPEEVLPYAAGADVGLCGVENTCLSYYYSLPNKLFEYLFSGLAVLVPDFPEMKKLVELHGCGWAVADDEASWLRVIATLRREEAVAAKERARAASASYSWQNEELALRRLYASLLKTHDSGGR